MTNKFAKLASTALLVTAAFTAPTTVLAGAATPSEVVTSLETYFKTDDVNAMMTLYSEETVMTSQPGTTVQGIEAIRPIMQGYADFAEKVELEVRNVYRTGDTALLIVDYIMTVKNQDGELVEMAGTATDVVKQADNGEWYYLIDNPFGVAIPDQG